MSFISSNSWRSKDAQNIFLIVKWFVFRFFPLPVFALLVIAFTSISSLVLFPGNSSYFTTHNPTVNESFWAWEGTQALLQIGESLKPVSISLGTLPWILNAVDFVCTRYSQYTLPLCIFKIQIVHLLDFWKFLWILGQSCLASSTYSFSLDMWFFSHRMFLRTVFLTVPPILSTTSFPCDVEKSFTWLRFHGLAPSSVSLKTETSV